jgi:hypothetical protein
MMNRQSMVLTCTLVSASCGAGTPKELVAPTPTIVTVTGTVTATNGGGPLAGLRVASEAVSATTDANGAFALKLTANADHRIDITGDGIIPRAVWSRGATATLDAIRIDPALGLDLTYYQQLVHNGLDGGPVVSQSLRRWIQSPRLYVRTVDEASQPVDQKLVDFTVGIIRDMVPQWSDGHFSLAEVLQGTDTRVGTAGWLTIIWPNPKEQGNVCGRPMSESRAEPFRSTISRRRAPVTGWRHARARSGTKSAMPWASGIRARPTI